VETPLPGLTYFGEKGQTYEYSSSRGTPPFDCGVKAICVKVPRMKRKKISCKGKTPKAWTVTKSFTKGKPKRMRDP